MRQCTHLQRHLVLARPAGLFDPIDNQPFWNVPVDAINTAASQANNWLATLSSFVLLKHDNQVLPLPKGKRIAVIGPHANATTAMAGNYLGEEEEEEEARCRQRQR